ncbi:MAG: polyprenyl synthetase family protein [Bacteroidales bacterium]|nr:polyprenyl synthetase family protein [Bacteroidales bacterium]
MKLSKQNRLVDLHTIEKEMIAFDAQWESIFRSPDAETQVLLDYLRQQKGGRIRPKMVFLAAGMGGAVTEESFRMAQLVELLHLSSLIHDDVIDHGRIRRGVKTVNAQYDNKLAVLLGDYLLSRSLSLMGQSHIPQVLQEISGTVGALTSGEMRQILHVGDFEMQESDYEKIVSQKTASLIQSAFVLGTLSAQYSSSASSAVFVSGSSDLTLVRRMGHLLGMAFQYKDDWKDYQPEIDGKGWGNDICEQQVTLPVIFAYRQMREEERKEFRQLYQKAATDRQAVQEVADVVRKRGGLACLEKKIAGFREELWRILPDFPEGPFRDNLWRMVEDITDTQGGVADTRGGEADTRGSEAAGVGTDGATCDAAICSHEVFDKN